MTNQEGEKAPKKFSKRRFAKRLFLVLMVLFIVLLVVVIFLPTILTSSFVESKIADVVGEKLEREVVVEGLSFGWATPLRIDRIEILPDQSEDDHSVFVLNKLETPLSIFQLTKFRNLSLSSISIEEVSGNLVRDEAGVWSHQKLLAALGSSEAPPKTTEPEPTESTQPSPLPIADFNIELREINLRVIDLFDDWSGGLEDAMIKLSWPGSVQPITVDASGTLFSQEESMPWDIRGKVEDWIDAEGFLQVEQAKLTSGSDGMMRPEQIANGGYFIRASIEPEFGSVARISIPLSKISSLASSHPILTDAPLPKGDIELILNTDVDATSSILNASAKIALNGVHVGTFQEINTSRTPLSGSVSTDLTFDKNENRIDRVSLKSDLPGIAIRLASEGIRLEDPLSEIGPSMGEITLDLAELWSASDEYIKALAPELINLGPTGRVVLKFDSEPQTDQLAIASSLALERIATNQIPGTDYRLPETSITFAAKSDYDPSSRILTIPSVSTDAKESLGFDFSVETQIIDLENILQEKVITYTANIELPEATSHASRFLVGSSESFAEGALRILGRAALEGSPLQLISTTSLRFDDIIIEDLESLGVTSDVFESGPLDLSDRIPTLDIHAASGLGVGNEDITLGLNFYDQQLGNFSSVIGLKDESLTRAGILWDIDLADLWNRIPSSLKPTDLRSISGRTYNHLKYSNSFQGDNIEGDFSLRDFKFDRTSLTTPLDLSDTVTITIGARANIEEKGIEQGQIEIKYLDSTITAQAVDVSSSFPVPLSTSIDSRFNLRTISEIASSFTTVPLHLEGTLLHSITTNYKQETLNGKTQLEWTESPSLTYENIDWFREDVRISASASLPIDRSLESTDWSSVTLQELSIEVPEILSLMISGNAINDATALLVNTTASIRSNIDRLVQSLPEEALESAGIYLATEEAEFTLDASFSTTINTTQEEASVEEIDYTLSTAIVVGGAEWESEVSGGFLAEAATEVSSKGTLRLQDPKTSDVDLFLNVSVGELELAELLVGEEVVLSASTNHDANGNIKVGIEEISTLSFQQQFADSNLNLSETILTTSASGNHQTGTYELEKLILEVSDYLALETSGAFNQANGTWNAAAVIESADIERLPEFYDMPALSKLPAFSTDLLIEADMKGTIPGDEMSDNMGSLLAGSATVQLSDIDYRQVGTFEIRDGNAEIKVELIDFLDHYEATIEAEVAEVVVAGLESKPLEQVVVSIGSNTTPAEMSIRINEASVINYGTTILGEVTLREPSVMNTKTIPILAKPFNVSLEIEQDLAGLQGITEGLEAEGLLQTTVSAINLPNRQLSFHGDVAADIPKASKAGAFEISDFSIDWKPSKRFALSPTSRAETSSTPGSVSIGRVALGPEQTQFVANNVTGTVTGFQEGIQFTATTPDMLGGSTRVTSMVGLKGQNPHITASLASTGLRPSLLANQDLRTSDSKPDEEVNFVANLLWDFPEQEGDRFLENIALNLDTTRVGRRAIVALLKALDTAADDPRFQNARAALTLGSPSSINANVKGGLASLNASLGIPGGGEISLPVVDRQPLAALLNMSSDNTVGDAIESLRTALLMLLAQDLRNIEDALTKDETAP